MCVTPFVLLSKGDHIDYCPNGKKALTGQDVRQ